MVTYIFKLLCPHYFWLGAWSAALRRILRLHSASGEVKMCGWWMPTAVLKSWCDMHVLRTWHTLSIVQTLFPDPSHCSDFCLSVSRIFIHSLLWWCNLKYLCTTYWGTRNKASYQLWSHSSTLLQDSWESCTRDSLSGLGHSCAIITHSVISADPCTAIHLALFFFGGDHTSWLVASLFHDQELNSGPQQWNCIVLTIGLPNNWHWTLALDCQRISSQHYSLSWLFTF